MARISKDVLSRTVDDEEVLLDLSTQAYFGLNPTGTRIWNLLKEGRTDSQIAHAISEEFDVSPSEAQRDVAKFIQVLEKNSLFSRETK